MLEDMKKRCGHSLAELLAALSIICIVAAIAAPALARTLEAQKHTAALNQMLSALQFSRASAVFERNSTLLCSGQEICNDSTNWSDHLMVFKDINNNGRRDATEPLMRYEPLPSDYSWHWASFRKLTYAAFEPDGTSRAANGTLTLCNLGSPKRQIIINLTGRIRHQPPGTGAACH